MSISDPPLYAESPVLTRRLKLLLEDTNRIAMEHLGGAWAGKDDISIAVDDRRWRYCLLHKNGTMINEGSMEECVEKFIAVCAAARLTGWKPKPKTFLDDLPDEVIKKWASSLYGHANSVAGITKHLTGKRS